MKICVLGNSHVASLKQGWDHISEQYQNHKIAFFASRQTGLAGLKLENGSLVPSTPQLLSDILFTSGGIKEVRLNEYDVFVLYGLGLTLPNLDVRLSAQVASQTCVDIINRTLNLRIARLIRSASTSPMYIGHSPQPAVTKNTIGSTKLLGYKEVFAYMSSALDIANTAILCQPAATLANAWHTKGEFSGGSTRLNVGGTVSDELHPTNDNAHMNREFGVLYLESFFQRLS